MDLATSALLTDLYQLNMMQAYLDRGETKTASFEFFVRKLPSQRGFLIAAGLEQVLEFLAKLRFVPEELEWLARTGRFGKDLIDYLAGLRFTGDIHAMPGACSWARNVGMSVGLLVAEDDHLCIVALGHSADQRITGCECPAYAS